jgi:DNA-nicking Smr family endonuclease
VSHQVAPASLNPETETDAALSEEELFRAAMEGIQKLPHDPRGRKERRSPSMALSPKGATEDEEALANLKALVNGHMPITLYETGEYVEGIAYDTDPRLARRLRDGEFAIQAYLDLHGYVVREAKEVFHQFLMEAINAGQRCVLIIHGRGHHSASDEPVLKKQVQTWLSQGSLSRWILAFTSARPCDGGAGAVYILLRRTARRKKGLRA